LCKEFVKYAEYPVWVVARPGNHAHSVKSALSPGEGNLAAVPSIGRASRVEGALAPEADATRALYEQYANQVFRYCLHQLGSREEAEDAVQSTFLNAFRGIKRGVVPELEAAWLFKIAHNVCLSRRRSTWRRGRIESPADFELIEELTPAPARRGDELIGLQDVLERLPDTQRRAILLREWQGLSYREIAAELELSQAAVETLIFRARRSLASGLEQPPEKKRRAFRALDWSSLVAGLKAAFVGGSVAAKVAAIAVVGAAAVAATEPLQHQRHQGRVVPKVHATAPVAHPSPSISASVRHVSFVRQVTHKQSVVEASAVRAGSKIAQRAGSPSAAAPGQVAHATGSSGPQGKSSLAPGHDAKPAVTTHAKHKRVVVHSRPQHVQPVTPQAAQSSNGHNSKG
jgi:RNA polymerase sigma factor (sigma-70 family)